MTVLLKRFRELKSTSYCRVEFYSGTGSDYGMVIVKLKPWEERELSVNDVIGTDFSKTSGIRDANIFFISPPTIQGFGQMVDLNSNCRIKGGHNTAELIK